MKYFISCFKQYAVFKGCTPRREYWYFILFLFLFQIAIGMIEAIIGTAIFLSLLFSIVMFLPSLASACRRAHDVNRRGWWLLIPGYNLVLLCSKSRPKNNRFMPKDNVIKLIGPIIITKEMQILAKFASLKDNGLISEEEFQLKMDQLFKDELQEYDNAQLKTK